MKGKNLKKALDLAVKAKLYDYIKKITAEIGEGESNQAHEDPQNLAKVAEHFIENGQVDKAVPLLIASKQVERALELCIQQNIPITEDMAK